MNMRKRLTELIQEKVHLCKNCVCVECDDYNGDRYYCLSNMIADHVIANGGILTPCNFFCKMLCYSDNRKQIDGNNGNEVYRFFTVARLL